MPNLKSLLSMYDSKRNSFSKMAKSFEVFQTQLTKKGLRVSWIDLESLVERSPVSFLKKPLNWWMMRIAPLPWDWNIRIVESSDSHIVCRGGHKKGISENVFLQTLADLCLQYLLEKHQFLEPFVVQTQKSVLDPFVSGSHEISALCDWSASEREKQFFQLRSQGNVELSFTVFFKDGEGRLIAQLTQELTLTQSRLKSLP